MKKKIIELIAFALVTAVLVLGVSYAIADRETTFSAVYSEPDNSVDVVIVGSSHVNSGYIPSMLWEENNLSAVNAFSWSQPMWVSYHYIVEALKTQSPDYIVLEMYGMVYGHSYIMPQEIDKTSYNNSFNLLPSWNRWQLIKTSEFCGLDLRNAQDFLYISRYHTRWKTFDWSYLSYNPTKQHDYLKGYGYLTNAAGIQTPSVEISNEEIVPYEYCVEYLDKIVKLCEEKGIELIFTLTPYVYQTEETAVLNWLERYSAEKGIPLFNYLYGEDYERIGFDYSTDLADTGHCNYNGAVKITQDLCTYLDSVGASASTQQEHPFYRMLSEDYSKFERVPALNVIMESSDIESFIRKAVNDKDVTLFINTYSADESILDKLNGILNPNNAPTDYNIEDMIITADGIANPAGSVKFEMFGKNGTVEFAQESCEIYLNGTAVPGGTVSDIKIVLFDNVLQRPVMSVWLEDGMMKTKEFTSDIIDNYK